MSKQTQLKVLDALEEVKFNITTLQEATNALLFVKNLKNFSEKVEKEVKEKADEIMFNENVSLIDNDFFTIKKVEPSISEEYKAESVFESLGEKALPFLKVNMTKLKGFLIKGTKTGEIGFDKIEECKKDKIQKTRKGFISIKFKTN